MNWSILLLLAVALPPLLAVVTFAVYRVATARHPGFWLLVALWSVAITLCSVLLTGFVFANSSGSYAGKPPHYWMELLAAFTVVVIGGLTGVTVIRRVVLGRTRRPSEGSDSSARLARHVADFSPPASESRTRFSWLKAVLGTGLVLLGVTIGGIAATTSKLRPSVEGKFANYAEYQAAVDAAPKVMVVPMIFFGAITVGLLVGGGLLVRSAVRGRSGENGLTRQSKSEYPSSESGDNPDPAPSVTGSRGHAWWKWGLLVLAGGMLVVGQIWFGRTYSRHVPNPRITTPAVVLWGAGAILLAFLLPQMFPRWGSRWRAARERQRKEHWRWSSEPSVTVLHALFTKMGFAIVLGGLALTGLCWLLLRDPILCWVFGGMFTFALLLIHTSHLKAVARGAGGRPSVETPSEKVLKTVRPLEPWRRQAIFWVHLVVTAFAVLFVIVPLYEKMGLTSYSVPVYMFIAFAAVSMTLGVREWAFKPMPTDGGVSAQTPPVVPLILTPDNTCATCRNAIPPDSPQGLCPRCLIRGAFPSPSITHNRPTRPVDPPPPSEVGEFFPHLEVLELVGAGGMGAVYKARQPNLDRVVALKIVQSPTGDDDPVFAERFAREARAMAKLDHPNIVTIHESGEAGGLPYLLMEFVDGITLRDAMVNKVLTTSEALAVVPQVCDALDYAHRNGVVHRDIKPENILIDQNGRVKIADFGLAKLAEPGGVTLTRTRQAMGTPHYMAPEQWEKPNEVDHRADIYALGVVLYELLTGELPLGRFDLPSAKGRGNPRLDEVVLRALAKEPGQRYQQASEIKTALGKLGNAWNDRGAKPHRQGFEYRSKQELWGWPLIHVVANIPRATGRHRIARGWIAVGDVGAVGAVAVGGVYSLGVVSVGGVISVGGLLALGGAVATGAVAVAGAVSLGVIAVGGALAVGKFAIGGGSAFGQYHMGPDGETPFFGNALGTFIRGLWPF